MTKLFLIKTIHTFVWLFFNAVLIYLFYAGISNKIDKWTWIGLLLFVVEGLVLVVFKMMCPLTIMARKYSASTKENFDIFLPEWLAKYNKTIYTSLLVIAIIIIIYRLLTNT